VTLKPGLEVTQGVKVIENDTSRSGTHDFLFMFHSNHRSILHHFQDKRQFPSKIINFSHPRVFCIPTEGVTLGIGYRRKGSKTRMMWLSDGWKVLR